MGLQDLANLGEFISSVAVILSLVYLAIQVRQNTASIRTENVARALERVSAMQSLLFANGDLARLQAQGVFDPSALTREERLQLTWWLSEAFGAFEFMFHQAQSGALPNEVWSRWSATTAFWASFPGVQAWWQAKPTPFSKSFTSFVDALIREGRSNAEAAIRFNEFLAGAHPQSSPSTPAADNRTAVSGNPVETGRTTRIGSGKDP
jgi:hypothetical protein